MRLDSKGRTLVGTAGTALGAMAVALAFCLSVVSAAPAAKVHKKRRAVSMTWYPKKSARYSDGQMDQFRAVGAPFGTVTVNAETPESEFGEDVRHPTFALFNVRRHVVHGRLRIRVLYLKTTKAYQTRSYKGTGVFALNEDDNPANFDYSGTITSISGVSTCYFASGHCTGSLTVKGHITY
jgi:hypothetical protein